MLRKIALVLATVKHLKLTQIVHQVKYRLKKPIALSGYDGQYKAENNSTLSFTKNPPVYPAILDRHLFTFLNISVQFEEKIDWNFQEHGKLWNYNLQYCNYLLQDGVANDEKIKLIGSLYDALYTGSLPLEPYPASLRIINMIRWYGMNEIDEPNLLRYVHAELDFLSQRPEYHLLGNHLLENGFALMMGGAFFGNTQWLSQGREIISTQLNEQVLADGAHFELSPMYHQLIFFRLLELIDWHSAWKGKEAQFETMVVTKAADMRAWLTNMTFKNSDIPHFNDSTDGIAYSSEWLLGYADKLNIKVVERPLGISGYRSVRKPTYECKVDFGQVGPAYQPGHAHADALGFILYHRNEPLFVEQGTSTYQIGERRSVERSTSAHNTVVVDGQNQSNVWGGFRVAERAKIVILEDEIDEISAQHDGYRKFGLIHKRSFHFRDDSILIIDEVRGNDKIEKKFHLHLYPGVQCDVEEKQLNIHGKATLHFDNAEVISIEKYEMANGYNNYKKGEKITVSFVNSLNTRIQFK